MNDTLPPINSPNRIQKKKANNVTFGKEGPLVATGSAEYTGTGEREKEKLDLLY